MILPVKVRPDDPKSLKDFMPAELQPALDPNDESFDPDAKALIGFLEAEILDYYNTTRSLSDLLTPDRCPPQFLENELGFELRVRFRDDDNDAQKRKRINSAVVNHKKSGRFNEDVKIRIDLITGLSSSIFNAVPGADLDGWVWVGDTGDDSRAELWGVWGGDTGDDSGMLWKGDGLEIGVAGNIFIDLGGDAGNPNAATIAKVVEELSADGQFAYLKIHLGFVVAGVFNEYANGLI